jgi:type II restriction/modification system DNA methylase subunit YeeA
LPEIPIKEALNKAFIKVRPERAAIETFKINFIRLLDIIKANPNESEEFLKNLVSDFLKKTWYGENRFINTKDRMDLVIHNGKDTETPVGVIIEAKKPGNKYEMVSRENLNAKAMQELLLYYFRETIDNKNVDLKHLIITNTIEWFVFDAYEFFRFFSNDKKLTALYTDFKSGSLLGKDTDYFYTQIAGSYIEHHKKDIKYVYFNSANYEPILRDTDKAADNKLISLYKLLSPEHLLKLSFVNDSNTLNQNFYAELLFIMGLSEEKRDSKKVIVRNKLENRKEGSLIENAIFQLSDFISDENLLFEIALELTLTWVNRILFLKLLESQQLLYQKKNPEYTFLNIDKIKNLGDLNTLFFKVLAQETKNRPESIRKRFAHVPYLNSSLFDMTNTEMSYFPIANLQETELPIFSGTVLKDRIGNKMKGNINTLQYIFEFLDAYDFSSEGSEEIQEENKTLINASVLGLIFEKINGYSDGSYFTPGFITTYICRETIRQVVVDKFNEAKSWKASSFDELKNYIDNKSIAGIKEANVIINSITICDPAVGSGHFLVSALNEIIAIKSDLGVLADSKSIKLKNCTAETVNDELMILDEDSNFYVYNAKNAESRRIQETIFREKRRIIEGSLFGVDMNLNSVKICNLRLWIELLKNAYYTEESGYTELETLPNIDINIKCGNSLISRFELDIDLKEELSKLKYTVKDYQEAVYKYKNAIAKNEKEELDKLIKDIKNNFKGGVQKNTVLSIKKGNLHGELDSLVGQRELFDLSPEEQSKREKRIGEIIQKIAEIERQIGEIDKNIIYKNAFEWRFEFPEVLNDNGDFIGFDAVIGNPPYIQLQDNHGELADIYYGFGYECFSRSGDIYQLFYERAYDLLKEKRYLCFITSNKWMRAAYGEKTRNFFVGKANPKILIDFAGQKVFESATVDVNIILLEKDENKQKTVSCIIKDDCKSNMTGYIEQHGNLISFPANGQSWVILSDIEKRIKEKIETIGKPLKDWDINIYRGILTGCNEAFIIDKQKRDELIKKDEKSVEIIRPILRGRDIARYQVNFADLYLINTHNGMPSKNILPIDIKVYPAIKEHLDKYIIKIKNRDDQGTTPYNLRSCAYMEDFSKQKITWGNLNLSAAYTLAPEDMFINAPATMIVPGDKYLLGILNSKLADYYIRNLGVTRNGGYFEYKPMFVSKMPIPILNSDEKRDIESLVTDVLSLKESRADFFDVDMALNNSIYDLYQLTEEEKEFINLINLS